METTNTTAALDLAELERGLFYGYMYWAEAASEHYKQREFEQGSIAQRISEKISAQHKLVRVMQGKVED